MKLSEVIKAKGKFKLGLNFGIEITDEYLIIKFWEQTLLLKLDDNWEEVKPPRQWSEKELMLFKLLPDWAKWIGTDKKFNITVSELKPTKPVYSDKLYFGADTKVAGLGKTFDFITITFEESPIYIGDLKGE